MNRRSMLFAGLALLLSFALSALPVHAADRPVLVGITVGDFSWEEGRAITPPGQPGERQGTLALRGRSPAVGKKWDQLRIGLPRLPSGNKPFLVLQGAEITAVAPAGEGTSTVSFVFEMITWTYETKGAPHFDTATDDE